jgi:hypothetical protein
MKPLLKKIVEASIMANAEADAISKGSCFVIAIMKYAA